MEKAINIPQDVTANIEKLQNEVDSRKELMIFMLDSGMPVNARSFTEYHTMYQKAY